MTPEERLTKIETETEKNTMAIRDLILVSRTVLTSIQELREVQRRDHEEWTEKMKELRDAQTATEEKLNILIDTVDRIIRNRDGHQG